MLPELLIKKVFGVPFEIAVERAMPVFVNVWVAEAKTINCREEAETVWVVRACAAALATGGWVSASINAPTAAATRDADLLLLLISLSFHQLSRDF